MYSYRSTDNLLGYRVQIQIQKKEKNYEQTSILRLRAKNCAEINNSRNKPIKAPPSKTVVALLTLHEN